jgi:mannose-6-phosphate isomerase-like protein (cupin superfamily)
MTLDYKNIPLEILPRLRDGSGDTLARRVRDENGLIMHGTLPPGSSIGLHTHQGNYEVIYILSGAGVCIDDGQEIPLSPGMVHYCPAGHSHSIVNTGDEPLVLFAVIPNC